MCQSDASPSTITISPGAALAHGCCGGMRHQHSVSRDQVVRVDQNAAACAGSCAPSTPAANDEAAVDR